MEPARRKADSDETEQLELVEQTMRKVAAERDPDLALLALLDRLRTQVRHALRRNSREENETDASARSKAP